MNSRFSALLLCLPLALLAAESTPAEQYALPAVSAEGSLPGEGALRRYDGYVKRWNTIRPQWAKDAAKDQGAIVFLGDSITQGWGTDFKKAFDGLKLANRGIGGDTTRGMLLRLQEDVLSLNPKAVVLLMGTNDIEVEVPVEAIGRNFQKIVAALKAHNPKMPVVVCRIFPSAASKKRPKETIAAVNALFDASVKNDPQFTVVDTYALFANLEGDALPDLFPDLLHPNAGGYAKWASALRPVFATLGYLDTQAEEFKPDPGFVSLFNGKDLTGWGFRPTPPRKAPKAPKPNAPLFVEVKQAESFDGKTESSDGRYRAINGRLVITTPAEGRRIQSLDTLRDFPEDFVLKLEFRATPNADSGVYLRKPQLQCRDYLVAGPYKDLKKYKAQDWNELVVTVKGGLAHAECNGELLEDAMKLPETGPIGLEGDRGQMEYRRLQIKTLAR
jgi:lysophospholipase L1-like esterase